MLEFNIELIKRSITRNGFVYTIVTHTQEGQENHTLVRRLENAPNISPLKSIFDTSKNTWEPFVFASKGKVEGFPTIEDISDFIENNKLSVQAR